MGESVRQRAKVTPELWLPARKSRPTPAKPLYLTPAECSTACLTLCGAPSSPAGSILSPLSSYANGLSYRFQRGFRMGDKVRIALHNLCRRSVGQDAAPVQKERSLTKLLHKL